MIRKVTLFGLTLLLALAVGFGAYAGIKRVVVRAGDNLGRIAERHGVSVKDLRRWNKKKIRKGDTIRLGDTLIIRTADSQPTVKKKPATPSKAKTKPKAKAARKAPTWMGHYRIQPGDTLGGIARKLGISVEKLLRFNKLTRKSRIRAGAVLKYEKPGQRPVPGSVGRPTQGRMVHSRHLGKGKGYRLRFPNNAYGMDYVNRTLRRCVRHVVARFPGTADILIGDISKPAGGSFPPHASHQSGRDVDIGYYLRGNQQNITLHRVGAYQVNYAKTWALFRCFLRVGKVVRVYMDEKIQKAFVRYLLKRKLLPGPTIKRLFDVVADRPRTALVRHSKGHDTHMHIRFACRPGSTRCQEESNDRPFSLKAATK